MFNKKSPEAMLLMLLGVTSCQFGVITADLKVAERKVQKHCN